MLRIFLLIYFPDGFPKDAPWAGVWGGAPMVRSLNTA